MSSFPKLLLMSQPMPSSFSSASSQFLCSRLKPTDTTTRHLAFVRIMMLLTIVFSLSEDIFESLNFQNDFKCKMLFYMNRVMRDLSIGTACLLSVLPAIIISPSASWLAGFKHKSRNYILHVFCLLMAPQFVLQ